MATEGEKRLCLEQHIPNRSASHRTLNDLATFDEHSWWVYRRVQKRTDIESAMGWHMNAEDQMLRITCIGNQGPKARFELWFVSFTVGVQGVRLLKPSPAIR